LAYIGNIPADKYTSFAKQDFTVTATTSYTLDHSVSNENEIALFINFVRQEPTTAYTCSSNQLTLTEATSVGDDMYCVFIGKAVQTVTPASSTITNDMLSETITVANGGTGLTSGFANGITNAEIWRLTSSFTSTNGDLTAWELADDASSGRIGTAFSHSSGIFTPSATGIYLVACKFSGETSNDGAVTLTTNVSLDSGSNYDAVAVARDGHNQSGTTSFGNMALAIVDVEDTSVTRIKFTVGSSSGTVLGDSNQNTTHNLFLRLGDT